MSKWSFYSGNAGHATIIVSDYRNGCHVRPALQLDNRKKAKINILSFF